MSDLVVLGLKLGFLALLWLFIAFVANVIRTDLFGRKLPAAELAQASFEAASTPSNPQRLSRKASKQLPTVLTVTHGKQAGLVVPLAGGVLIGRAADCQLILDDDYVSTHHARISLSADGYQVDDLGSTNGSFLNNERLTATTPFGPGDTLRIGRTLMSVEK
jgi:pSer/pThr/pTyr-binding forkhead associated (FHA) protein